MHPRFARARLARSYAQVCIGPEVGKASCTMCGIASFSIASGYDVDASRLAKLLLAGLAERGEDASGYASRGPDGRVEIVKHALPPHEFLASIPVHLVDGAREAIVHVRDHTKGRPTHHGNNHPIRHGAVCGVHNGIIQNDDELFLRFGRERALPGMSVDSEAIFMLLDALPGHVDAFAHLVGSYCIACFDDRDPQRLLVARGKARPLVLARGEGIVICDSTRHAVEFASTRLGLDLRTTTVPTGTLMYLADGELVERTRFAVTPFSEKRTVRYSRRLTHAQRARELADGSVGQVASTP